MSSETMSLLFGIEVEDTTEYKKCNHCQQELPVSDFSPSGGGKYLRSKCRKCERKITEQRNKFKHYTPPENHVCPICQKTEEECKGLGGVKVGTWCLDHDHESGDFRGWLCHSCNRNIGNFKDNISILENAIEYLTNHKVQIER